VRDVSVARLKYESRRLAPSSNTLSSRASRRLHFSRFASRKSDFNSVALASAASRKSALRRSHMLRSMPSRRAWARLAPLRSTRTVLFARRHLFHSSVAVRILLRAIVSTADIVNDARRPNFSQQLMAGRSPRSGLKPLLPAEMHGVTSLADAARRHLVSCGKRRAALPPACGASPQLSETTLGGRIVVHVAGTLSMKLRVRRHPEDGSAGGPHAGDGNRCASRLQAARQRSDALGGASHRARIHDASDVLGGHAPIRCRKATIFPK
jgi:hypothetical protein